MNEESDAWQSTALPTTTPTSCALIVSQGGVRPPSDLQSKNNGRELLRNRYIVCAAGWLLSTVASVSSGAQPSPAPDPVVGYQVVHGWPVLPEGEVLGSVAGVGVDSRMAMSLSFIGQVVPGPIPMCWT